MLRNKLAQPESYDNKKSMDKLGACMCSHIFKYERKKVEKKKRTKERKTTTLIPDKFLL